MSDAVALPLNDDRLGPPERLHPLFLLTGLGQSVKGAWGLLAGGAVLGAQGRWGLVLGLGIAMAVVSVGALFLKWLKLEYRVGQDELRIDSGFLSRTSRAIPFDRVTDVDLEQGPLHRLFGLARVRLETGASAGANQEDGVLHTISLERAEALREHIRARRTGHSRVAFSVPAESEAPALFAMDKRRVAIAGLFNFSLAVIAGLFGVTQTFGDVLGFDPFKRSFWMGILDRAGPLQELVMAHQIVAVVGGTIVLLALGIGTGLVRTTLREYGFRLDRTETGFRRRRGLFTLTDVTIPERRVQAAILGTGPIRRHFGWRILKLQSLAMDGKRGDHVVAPLADEAECDAILTSLEWPIAPRTAWAGVSSAYVWSYGAVAALPLAAVLALILLEPIGVNLPLSALGLFGLLGLCLGASAMLVRWLAWRLTRYSLDGAILFVETGWWRSRRRIVPLAKIQSVDLAENFWGRRFGICTLRLGVAGGRGFADHHVPALRRPDAETLRARLLSQ